MGQCITWPLWQYVLHRRLTSLYSVHWKETFGLHWQAMRSKVFVQWTDYMLRVSVNFISRVTDDDTTEKYTSKLQELWCLSDICILVIMLIPYIYRLKPIDGRRPHVSREAHILSVHTSSIVNLTPTPPRLCTNRKLITWTVPLIRPHDFTGGVVI